MDNKENVKNLVVDNKSATNFTAINDKVHLLDLKMSLKSYKVKC